MGHSLGFAQMESPATAKGIRMSDGKPLVTISLSVTPQANILANALGSILGQDYAHLQVIVSGDGSSNDVRRVCDLFAERDVRVHFRRGSCCRAADVAGTPGLPSASPAVGEPNAPGVFDGRYHMLAREVESWSPSLVSSLVHALEDEPDAVLAIPAFRFVDARQQAVSDGNRLADLAGPLPLLERANRVLWFDEGSIKSSLALGLARTDALERIGFDPESGEWRVWRSAELLALALAFQGYFVYVPDACCTRREAVPWVPGTLTTFATSCRRSSTIVTAAGPGQSVSNAPFQVQSPPRRNV
jgi:hypothetical protein